MEIARQKGLVLMVGHTFLYSPAVRKIKEIVDRGDMGEIRYICARRLNLGLFQKDINVAWDLAPHDISIILHLLGAIAHQRQLPRQRPRDPGMEDVTSMSLTFHERPLGHHPQQLAGPAQGARDDHRRQQAHDRL